MWPLTPFFLGFVHDRHRRKSQRDTRKMTPMTPSGSDCHVRAHETRSTTFAAAPLHCQLALLICFAMARFLGQSPRVIVKCTHRLRLRTDVVANPLEPSANFAIVFSTHSTCSEGSDANSRSASHLAEEKRSGTSPPSPWASRWPSMCCGSSPLANQLTPSRHLHRMSRQSVFKPRLASESHSEMKYHLSLDDVHVSQNLVCSITSSSDAERASIDVESSRNPSDA